MTTVRKTLGQSAPAAATDATLYTVPALTDAVVSTIVACETNGAATTIKVCTDAAGGVITAVGKAIAWNLPITANGTITFTIGAALAAASTIIVQSASGKVTFTAYGQENS